MEHETNIDTLELRIEFKDKAQQLQTLIELENYIRYNDLVIKDIFKTDLCLKKDVIKSQRLICSILSGLENKDAYIHIRFAGLKSHINEFDELSEKILFKVVSYLNVRGITFKLREIDNALDVYTEFNEVITLAMKKSPNSLYYTIHEKQPYKTTKCIEKFINKKHESNATKRCYQYCKSTKENLDIAITRVEAKYQKKYFSKHNYQKMLNELNKHYLVLHIEDKETREWILEKLKKEDTINARVIKRYRLDRYRIKFDTEALKQFIEKIFTYVDNEDFINFEKEKVLEDADILKRDFNDSLLNSFSILNQSNNEDYIDASMLNFNDESDGKSA